MSKQLPAETENKALPISAEVQSMLSNVFIKGDISVLDNKQRAEYVKKFCERLGLDPFTQPFMILRTNGKESLYATKAAAEQLCRIHGVSISFPGKDKFEDVFGATARAELPNGRFAEATGYVTIGNLRGDALCNAFMKAETKAMRRATLRLLGLGMLDETEISTIPNAQTVAIPQIEAEVVEEEVKPAKKSETKSRPAGKPASGSVTNVEVMSETEAAPTAPSATSKSSATQSSPLATADDIKELKALAQEHGVGMTAVGTYMRDSFGVTKANVAEMFTVEVLQAAMQFVMDNSTLEESQHELGADEVPF